MMSLLNFTVEGITCAIPYQNIKFVVQMVALHPPVVPGGRIVGLAVIEGIHLPVYSLRQLFGFADRSPLTSDILIIAQADSETVALWADETSGVTNHPAIGDAIGYRDYAGLHISSDGFVIINNLPVFLNFANPGLVHDVLPSVKTTVDCAIDNPDMVKAILEKRAKKMAKPVKTENKVMPIEILKFRLAYEEYAMPMDQIREVDLTGEITPVPGTPNYIAGICAIRGEIISLVDLREFFNIRGKGLTDLNRVIVLSDGTITFGILADFITGTGVVLHEMLTPVRSGQTPIAEKYLLGAVDNLLILNAAALLADPAMVIDETRT